MAPLEKFHIRFRRLPGFNEDFMQDFHRFPKISEDFEISDFGEDF